MRKLRCPTQGAGDVFTLCISRVRNDALRDRLELVTDRIVAGSNDYAVQAASVNLHSLAGTNSIAGIVTGEEMNAVYTMRMVPKTQPGRGVYNALISAAPRGRCPLCGVGQIATLDHHLPKSRYPLFSVTPTNLVPACTWCQTEKREAYPARAEEQTLHPYFDDFDSQRWLNAAIIRSAPATFVFAATQPAGYTLLTVARLRRHLEIFRLDKLFSSNAADELMNIRFALQKLYDVGGGSEVKAHLRDEADSRERVFKNSWQTAMYRAAEANDWFCDGGFALE